MRTFLVTALATVAFASAPVLAQTNQSQSGQGQTQTQAAQPQQAQGNRATQGTSPGAGMATQGGAGMSSEQMAASQQRVIDSLNQAGLTDVKIMDAAYLVQATTPDDEEVIMIVNSSGQPMSPARMGQSNNNPSSQGTNQTPGAQTGGQTTSPN